MRSKAPLMLMELTVMLLVLALAAALCLQAFLWADTKAKETVNQDTAARYLQNAAEVLKNCGGDYTAAADELEGSWDGEMLRLKKGELLILVHPEERGVPLLGGAVLEALWAEKVIAQLRVSWQEVDYGK